MTSSPRRLVSGSPGMARGMTKFKVNMITNAITYLLALFAVRDIYLRLPIADQAEQDVRGLE
jgi:hypothetical protein